MRTDANTYSSYSREYSSDQTSALKLINPPPPGPANPTPSPSLPPAHHPRYFSYIISQLNLDFTFINRRGATRWRVCTWYLNSGRYEPAVLYRVCTGSCENWYFSLKDSDYKIQKNEKKKKKKKKHSEIKQFGNNNNSVPKSKSI